MSTGFIVTQRGLRVLAKVLAGTADLKFTRVGLGDCGYDNGSITTVTDEQAFERTQLIRWKKDLPIVENPSVDDSGVVYLKFLVANADVQAGFWMCETGIFVENPDDPTTEILYAYEFQGLEGGYLPPTGGYEVWEHLMIAAIAVGQAQNVTAVVTSNIGGASYTLPTATNTRLGGVKVGYGLSVALDGTLSRAAGVILDSVPSTVEGAMWYVRD